MKDLRIENIKITGFRGIEQIEVNPTELTLVRGTNGAGKSSFEDAVLDIFQGGNHPENVRHGCKAAVTELKLNDGRKLVKRQTPKGQTTTVLDANGVELPKAMEIIKGLANGPALQPEEFINAKPAERIAWLVGALGLTFSSNDIVDCLPQLIPSAGGGVQREVYECWVNYNPGIMDLPNLDKIRQKVYVDRTAINRAAESQEKEIKVISDGLPEVSGDGTAEATHVSELKTALKRHNEEERTNESEVRAFAQGKIDAIKRDMEAELTELRTGSESVRLQFEKSLTSLTDKLSAHQRATGSRKLIAEKTVQARNNRTAADHCTAILDAIDMAKAVKLSKIPVPGLSIRGEDLCLGQTPFDSLSTGEKIELAGEICTLAPGKLGLVVLDEVNRIADDRLPEFLQSWKDSGLQVICAVADAGELAIDTR